MQPKPYNKDISQAKTLTAGIDIGSLTAQMVILADDDIVSYSNILVGPNNIETAYEAANAALKQAGVSLEAIQYIVATGYGRVTVPFAKKSVTEIACHARGAHWFFPNVRTILDMGGQDVKVIRCDENGKVVDFLLNDKCAAGCGRYMEVMADLVAVSLDDIGKLSLDIKKEPPHISSGCVVFAKSEALALLRRGTPKNEILAACCDGLVRRVINLIKRMQLEKEFQITGGIAKNIGVVTRIEKELGLKAQICFEPQIVGALGAALFARAFAQKGASATRGAL